MFKVGEQRKLVLGFDAGCGTCSNLAARIQGRVGNKLSVENLNTPQLLEWRRVSLGEDTPWAPTLFEVEGGEVLQAWTGWRMGYALSRKLGPAATWQVMQALGEAGDTLRIEELPIAEKLPERAAEAAVGMSRGQFLKGIGGTAVALSALSTGIVLPSSAEAATSTGTAARQRLAKSIVRNSSQFKALAVMQSQLGTSFNFSSSVVKVHRGSLAGVRIASDHHKRAVIAVFLVDLRKRTVELYQHIVYARIGMDRSKPIKVTRFENGRVPRAYHQVVMAKNAVITDANRMMSFQAFKQEIELYKKRRVQTFQAFASDYDLCVSEETNACNEFLTYFCTVVGAAALFSGPFAVPIGGGALVSCALSSLVLCPGAAKSACEGLKEPPTVIQQPPRYYC